MVSQIGADGALSVLALVSTDMTTFERVEKIERETIQTKMYEVQGATGKFRDYEK